MSHQTELRRTLGRTIRTLRENVHLSLDDIERVTDEIGIRVTRSHLSRVENGQADLALPRFLGLMHALGEPPLPVLERIDAVIRNHGSDPVDLDERAAEAYRRRAWDRAASCWRAACAISRGRIPEGESLAAWSTAEAALGRWRNATRLTRSAVSRLPTADSRVLLRASAAALGGDETGSAWAFARAVTPGCAWSRLLEIAAIIAWNRPIEAAERLARDEGSLSEGPVRTMAMILASEAFRSGGRLSAALTLAEKASRRAEHAVLQIEADLAWARALAASRRPSAGLRAVGRALRTARPLRLSDLVACAHGLAEELHRLDRAPGRARDAGRACRAVMRRHGSDRQAPRTLPLQSLLRGDVLFGLAGGVTGDDQVEQARQAIDPGVASVEPESHGRHASA